jgi:manganese/zinc/iron transport system permease protein
MNWIWTLDGPVLLVAVCAAIACALPGTFLVLRRMSMMGDAISHAVLPGLVIAFVVTGTRGSWPMFVGAAVVGVLTAWLTEVVRKGGNVDEGASMGVVFTSLFAVGLVLVNLYGHRADLDPGCVLYGMLETVGNSVAFDAFGIGIPWAAVKLGIVAIVNLLLVVALFKEFRISSFDPALATTVGINATFMHFLLMTMTAVTTVAAFEAVGSILVVAMLIVPAATAHLLTDRLWLLVVLGMIIAVASAVVGHLSAIVIPAWIGLEKSLTVAPMVAVAGGAMLFTAVFFSPGHGVVSKWWHRAMLSIRIAKEDVLATLSREDDRTLPVEAVRGFSSGSSSMALSIALRLLRRAGQIETRGNGQVVLTETGHAEARRVLRSHRIWETYLAEKMNVAPDHTHGKAHRLEHVSPDLADKAADELGQPVIDPDGKQIPQ